MAARGFAIRYTASVLSPFQDFGGDFVCESNEEASGVQFCGVHTGATLRDIANNLRMNIGECLWGLRNRFLNVNKHLRKRQVRVESVGSVAI